MTSNIIIDTKPAVVKNDVVKISPSKTVSHKIETVQEVSSIVQINSGPDPNPQSKKPGIKHSPVTRVNVIESKPVAPIIVSKVQVIEEVKPVAKQHIITKVEVVSEAPKSVSLLVYGLSAFKLKDSSRKFTLVHCCSIKPLEYTGLPMSASK